MACFLSGVRLRMTRFARIDILRFNLFDRILSGAVECELIQLTLNPLRWHGRQPAARQAHARDLASHIKRIDVASLRRDVARKLRPSTAWEFAHARQIAADRARSLVGAAGVAGLSRSSPAPPISPRPVSAWTAT